MTNILYYTILYCTRLYCHIIYTPGQLLGAQDRQEAGDGAAGLRAAGRFIPIPIPIPVCVPVCIPIPIPVLYMYLCLYLYLCLYYLYIYIYIYTYMAGTSRASAWHERSATETSSVEIALRRTARGGRPFLLGLSPLANKTWP